MVRGSLTVAMGLAASLAAFGLAAAATIERPATATAPAVRSRTQLQVLPRPAPPTTCKRVIVIGDSLMDNSEPWLIAELDAAGFDSFVDAQPSRQIPAAMRPPLSGVVAAQTARTTWGEAECWMVALGSNDILFGGGQSIELASARIGEMLAAVSPGASVWWVNVDFHHDPRAGIDMVAATRRFNEALDRRAANDARLTVIDWYSLAEANLHWFFDPVHVDRAGSIARAEFTVAALPRPG
jgi:hypothetical protein